jgi:RNA recognition motif-containing protein
LAGTNPEAQLNEEADKIGRIKPYIVNKKEELDEYSIYVEGLTKPYDNEQHISELFNKLVGHVSFFRIPANQHGMKKFFGYCFIEFDSKENVTKAVELVNRHNRSKATASDSSAAESTKLIDKLNLRVMSK